MRKPIRRGGYGSPSISGYGSVYATPLNVPTPEDLVLDLDSEWDVPEPILEEVSLSPREMELCDTIDALEKLANRDQQDNEILRQEVDRLSAPIEIILPHTSYIKLIEQAFDKGNFEMKLSTSDGRIVHLKVKG